MEDPKQQLLEQIRIQKKLAATQRKLKDIQIEDTTGKRNLRYATEDLYAPIIEATKTANTENVKKLDELALVSANTNKELELYKTGTQELVNVLQDTKKTIQEELEADIPRKVVTEKYGAVPDDVLIWLANKSDEALCIEFDEERNPPGLVLGGNPVQSFHSDFIKVNNKTYKMTPGAWQILTRRGKASLDGVTEEDKELYCQLIFDTGHIYTIDSRGNKLFKSSKSAKYAMLKAWGIKVGKLTDPTKTKTAETKTGEGLNVKEVIKYIVKDYSVLVPKLYTTILNLKAGHTNIDQNDIHLAYEILDMLYKDNHLSQKAFKNIYTFLGNKNT